MVEVLYLRGRWRNVATAFKYFYTITDHIDYVCAFCGGKGGHLVGGGIVWGREKKGCKLRKGQEVFKRCSRSLSCIVIRPGFVCFFSPHLNVVCAVNTLYMCLM